MDKDTLTNIVSEEVAEALPGISSVIVEAIVKMTGRTVNDTLRQLRNDVAQRGAKAWSMASAPEMKGYSQACAEIVAEIDRIMVPMDPRGRLLPSPSAASK